MRATKGIFVQHQSPFPVVTPDRKWFMNTCPVRPHRGLRAILILIGLAGSLAAQPAPEFKGIQSLTNHETLLNLNAPTGLNYRIEVSTNLPVWQSLLTLLSTGLQQNTDSATPFLGLRFYRAVQLTGTNILTGDNIVTDDGDVVVHPVNHASFVMSWNGKMIYNDPVGAATLYQGMPKADLLLISHDHSDHYSTSTISSVQGTNTVIIVPQYIYNLSSFTSFRSKAVVLPNGASTNLMGLTIQAIPAYNSYHPQANGYNGYVLTVGGKRIFMSGDTGNIAEMRALTNIDVAFVCMNMPYTMTVNEATNAVRAFHPKVVYPYHYRDQSGAVTNAASFKKLLGTGPGIEVRLRNWY